MPDKFSDLLDTIPKELNMHRTFPGPFYYMTFKYSRESSNREGSGISVKPSPFLRILSGIHLKTYKALSGLLIPDIYSEWLPFAIMKGLELVRKNTYSIIISSSEPRVCHLIGYFLKKRSDIPWIADYGDPWIYPVPTMAESNMKKSFIKKIEKSILKRMDAITVASEGIKKLYLERYPFLNKEHIHIVTQGFGPDVISRVVGDTPYKFRIVYCGSLYKNLRDPMAFFEAIKGIDKEDIEVVVAGRINEFADILKKEFNSEAIKYCGFLGHKESLALQKGATILLHIGNTSDVQVPGKIYEYIGAKRPILCVRGGNRDVSADLISRYNKGIIVDNNNETIKEGILKFYDLWKKDLLDKNFNFNEIEEFTWQKSAVDIINIIEKL